MYTLKRYQTDTLNTLRSYFRLARTSGGKRAFLELVERLYHSLPKMPAIPFVCVRIPTGGGKTLLACASIPLYLQEYLRQEQAVILWLVPTNTIKEQTLRALTDPEHPYRQQLEAGLGGNVVVMDAEAAYSIQKNVLDRNTVIIISTIAAGRVDETEGRRFYGENGALLHHFSDLPVAVSAGLETYENGRPIPSLANVLFLRSPMVIVDDAHNNNTDLSFETLARFNPSFVLEYTATPANAPRAAVPSNVLVNVSAFELKAESMIKLPIYLELRDDWRRAISESVSLRADLETAAGGEQIETGEYIRPIALYQAQPKDQALTVDAIRAYLVDELQIPDEQVAVETGAHYDVKQWEDTHPGKTLFDESCPIRHIITVQKLREGWDCPFAYVLCSVSETGSTTYVEQILGRVLRMPRATSKKAEKLNFAYAYVTSPNFGKAVQVMEGIRRGLMERGFSKFEAEAAIAVQSELPGLVDGEDTLAMLPLFTQRQENLPPAERGEPLVVPQLCLFTNGEHHVVEEGAELPAHWLLRNCSAIVPDELFSPSGIHERTFEVDVDQAGETWLHPLHETQKRLSVLVQAPIMTRAQLIAWLERRIPHGEITQDDMQLFLLSGIDHLISQRGFSLETLVAERFGLSDAFASLIGRHLRKAKTEAFNLPLFSPGAPVKVSPERVFTFDPHTYPVGELYTGKYRFNRHYYRMIGKMNDEEADCAMKIDTHPTVRYWVRNLERKPRFSFWLPTPTDRFYPDFVALLTDGRHLVVEYKGGHIMETADTEEKTAIGKLWEAHSGGSGLFLLVGADDYDRLISGIHER